MWVAEQLAGLDIGEMATPTVRRMLLEKNAAH